MKKLILIVILTALFKQILFGQGGFSKNYVLSGSYVSVCTDVLEAPNGNIIMTGLTFDSPTGSNRLTIIGADAQGNHLWQKNYGNSKFEYLDYFSNFSRNVIKDLDCFYFYSAVLDSNNKYFSVFIKFNFNGDTLWQKKYYDTFDYLYIYDVIRSVDNGFLMTGTLDGTGGVGCLLIKTDSIGNELWRKKLIKTAPPNVQAGESIVQDSITKKIIIAGYQFNGTASAYNIFANIIVTDSLGIELQRKSYSGVCGGEFHDLIQTKDKNIVAVGLKDQCSGLGGPNGSNRYKGYAIKVNLNNLNNIIWSKELDTLCVYNSFATINELKNGDLILSGILDTLKNYGVIEKGMLRLTKLDKDGNVKANKLFSRDNEEKNSKWPRSLNITQNGSYLIANELYYATNPRPYSITKIDSMFCDSTVAYCYSVGFNELKLNNENIKIYPNPTNGVLNTDLKNIFTKEDLNIKLVNILGQIVVECKLEKQLDISDLKHGIYFLQFYDKDKLIATKKIIKE